MREHVHLHVLANWVSMLRSSIVGAILLPDDDAEAPFYERLAHETARVVPAAGLALELLDIVSERGIRGVVAVVGRSSHVTSTAIFRPEVGDVASLLIISSAFDQVLRDICGQAWINSCTDILGSLRHRAAEAVHDRDYQFDSGDTIEKSHESVSQDDASQEWVQRVLEWREIVLDGSRSVPLSLTSRPKDEIEQLREIVAECDGSTVLDIITRSIDRFAPHGIRASRTVTTSDLFAVLRVAYPLAEFEDDNIFWNMRAWERSNSRYPLLRAWRAREPFGVLWDQRYWDADLRHMLRATRDGGTVGIVKMDLDGFKTVNELRGHAVGDEAIRLYCNTVAVVFGRIGEAYRRGGDEVVVLLPGIREPELDASAERVRVRIREVFAAWSMQRQIPPLTVSIGTAFVVDPATTAEGVSAAVDEAQTTAKREGKDRVVKALMMRH